MTAAAWNDEHKKRCFELAREGNSASIIAVKLYQEFGLCKTRMAVIGVCNRNSISLSGATHNHRGGGSAASAILDRIRRRTTAERAARRWKQLSPVQAILRDGLPLPPPHETDVARVSFDRVQDNHCRWIPADLDEKGYPQNQPLYCGNEKVAGTSWCAHHLKRAHNAPTPRSPAPQPKAPARQPTFYEMEDVA